ncbi:HAMP domain-containing histidine kinase [Halobacillus litoralis]|uniref:sensor histidine kinase n=1 Tax=Halobacillus litoralis TaxID=45668 RepID=UPI001CD30C0A|nr:HAMP domain-containing sensor histidine kinase [Halobacillus litoralis]MCA0971139.1 HAMP domain-containing histidine kinase [Halobacillus litoralis]
MKLHYQLNAAFTALILVLMTITAFFIYSLLMDMLILDERRQLEARADILIDVINDQSPSSGPTLSQLVQDRNYPMLLFNQEEDVILFRTMPANIAQEWVLRYEGELVNQEVWAGGGERFVVYDFPLSPRSDQVLVMATPLNDLQAVQSVFALRMIVVILIGLILAVLISYFFTRRLVTPLSRLKLELKKIEKRQFDQLEAVEATGEIKEVEQSVRNMASELSRYIHSQKQFFQNASHELKTPLQSIQGYAEGIRDGIFEGEAAEKGYNVMISETERLKKIVNEMILLAKLDSSEDVYHPERTDIMSLVTQAHDRLLPLAQEKGVALSIQTDESFYAEVDHERVLQAFINIISNAIRHAEHEVRVETFEKNQSLVVKVSDDGEGIPQELLSQLFERFMKGKGGETGLGLAISRAIVERSGGSIKAYNESGAVFEIELPSD